MVQRGRQEASAPRLLEKCGPSSMATGLAPFSIVPNRHLSTVFFMRPEDCSQGSILGWKAGAEGACYQEVLCFLPLLWLPV